MDNISRLNDSLDWDINSVNSDTSLIVIDLHPINDGPTESSTDPVETEIDTNQEQHEEPPIEVRDDSTSELKASDSQDAGVIRDKQQNVIDSTCSSPRTEVEDGATKQCMLSPSLNPGPGQVSNDDVTRDDDPARTLAKTEHETSNSISLELGDGVVADSGHGVAIYNEPAYPIDCNSAVEGEHVRAMDEDSVKPHVKDLRRVFEVPMGSGSDSENVDENDLEHDGVTVTAHDNKAYESEFEIIESDWEGSISKQSYDETDRQAIEPVSDALEGSSNLSDGIVANVPSLEPKAVDDQNPSGNHRIPLHTYENVAPPVHGYENVILEFKAEHSEKSDTLGELKNSETLDKLDAVTEQEDSAAPQQHSPAKKRVSFSTDSHELSKLGYSRSLSAKSADSNSSDYQDPEIWHAIAPPTRSSTPQKSTAQSQNGDASDILDESSHGILSAATPFNDSGEQLVNVSVDSSHPGASYSVNGVVEKSAIEDKTSGAADALAEDEKWLEWAKNKFRDAKGQNKQLSFKEFKKALNIRGSFFAGRFFDQFDTNHDGHVDTEEMVDTLVQFTKGKSVDKMRFLFNIYDVNGDGTIDPEELKTVLEACMKESNLRLSEDSLEKLTLALFDEADTNGNGQINFDELVTVLEQYPEVMSNMSISAAQWLKELNGSRRGSKRNSPQQKTCCVCCPKSKICTKKYIQNNISSLVAVILYICINVALFASCIRYMEYNWCVIIARGCGMCLNFNCALIVMFMLRHTITWLRSSQLNRYLPLDDAITFHKGVGVAILVFSLVHTAAHLGNIAYVRATPLPDITTSHPEFWEYLFTLKSQVGYVGPGFGYLSGVICLVILLIMCICAMPCIRRNGYFEVFYWTHLLYILFFIFLITHGPIFYIFFLIPGAMFIVEKVGITLLAHQAIRTRHGTIHIEKVNLLPSKVTHLTIKRPSNFVYRPGDWIFIRIPAIARFEWHPFTISSNPERRDELWLHIRSAGHWTNKLYEYFDKYEELTNNSNDDAESGTVLENSQSNNNQLPKFTLLKKKMSVDISKGHPVRRIATMPAHRAVEELQPTKLTATKTTSHSLKHSSSVNTRAKDIMEMWRRRHSTKHVRVMCAIEGPYGTPTRDIFDTEHAVLVGAGIGVTPMASILQSIMYRYKQLRRTCPNCHHNWYGEMSDSGMKLKKVHFIWINRDQYAFEWFVNMLIQLEIEQGSTETNEFGKFLEMEMYMTGAASMNDIKGLGLQVALELIHKKENTDLVTGLHTRTKPGRPNWRKIFDNIEESKKGKVKVFFCGAPMLANILKDNCSKRGYEFVQEVF